MRNGKVFLVVHLFTVTNSQFRFHFLGDVEMAERFINLFANSPSMISLVEGVRPNATKL
jgi:hypothetical protein